MAGGVILGKIVVVASTVITGGTTAASNFADAFLSCFTARIGRVIIDFGSAIDVLRCQGFLDIS